MSNFFVNTSILVATITSAIDTGKAQIQQDKENTRIMREYKVERCELAAYLEVLDRMLANSTIYGYSYDSGNNSVRVYFFQEAVRV